MPARPLLIFDGDCSFCRRWVARWQSVMHRAIDFEPYQSAAARFPEVWVERFKQATHLVEPDGRIRAGAEAIFRAHEIAGRRRWLMCLYRYLPGFAAIAEVVYNIIASHRNTADWLDRLLIGRQLTSAPTYFLSRWLLLRSLGVIYLIAFASLFVQIDGLIGSKGILPIGSYLDLARRALGGDAYWRLPTLCWIDPSDRFLRFLCAGGMALSVALILGIATMPVLLLLWMFYLSLVVAGQDFLNFQWDSLLLEAGFAALFVAPWTILPGVHRQRPPPTSGIWLMRWLVFRVMFLSGVVKLAWHDPTWLSWKAMKFHYQTQPLPTWTSWWMQQLPPWFQTISVIMMFTSELLVPFLIFGTRRLRFVAFWWIVIFQLLIAATGNFGFFNFLTIVICLAIPDDSFWPAPWRRLCEARVRDLPPRWPWRAWIAGPLVGLIILVTSVETIGCFSDKPLRWPAPVSWVLNQVQPLRSMNDYGLFRVMTRTRPEIVLEGSDDGIVWKPYVFRYKPGDDLTVPPKFCEPHMPRLDWQMWFAALGSPQQNPWFYSFAKALLEGSPPVLALLKDNPFPDRPPRYLRALLYEYRFTDRATRKATGAWWRRELLGLYCPVMSLPPTQAAIDPLWDFNDAAGSEQRFRQLLGAAYACHRRAESGEAA